jgi:mono/diheme cytochrome c family protein
LSLFCKKKIDALFQIRSRTNRQNFPVLLKEYLMKRHILLTSSLVFFVACGKKSEEAPAPAPVAAVSGEAVYNEKGCVTCHGPQGKGDGPAGAALKPKPRNFADAKWKNGYEVAQIIKTLENGIPGSGMASYKGALTEEEMKAVAEYVRKLGGKN